MSKLAGAFGGVIEAKLTAAERDKLPDHMFAVPGKRMLPMHDKEHAELAWSMMDRTEGLTADEKATGRKRILARMKELGMDTSKMHAEEAVRLVSGTVERVLEAASGGARLEVTIIRAGESNNRMRYAAGVLEAAAPMFEGAAAFCDHPGMMDQGRAGGRSLRDLVGVYEGTRWDAASSSVRGTLRLYPGAEWLGSLIREALTDRESGRPAPNVGVSADMLVVKSPIVEPAAPGYGVAGVVGAGGSGAAAPRFGRLLGYEVRQIAKVNSADVVFQPAAGGRFERIVEAYGLGGPGRDGTGRGSAGEHTAAAVREGEALTCTRCGMENCGCPEGTREGAGDPTARERAAGTLPVVDRGAAPTAGSAGTASGGEALISREHPEGYERLISRELEAARAVRVELCRGLLDQRLAAAGLAAPAAEYLRGRFTGRAFEASELDGEITSLRGMLGAVVAPGVVRGMGPASGLRIEGGRGVLERVQLAMDRLFGLPLPDAVSDVPRFSGIREAYLRITGDSGFTGQYNWPESALGQAFEADEVTTSIMANIVASSMTKKLIKDYSAQPKWWLPFVSRTAIRDMKVHDRIALYDFGVFPTVNENAAYVNLAWDDIKETYTPAKKGSTVYITLETIINDDLRAVARIPSKLAASAAVTINEFVSGLFTANSGSGSTMVGDSVAVFHAGSHQSNLGSTALSSAAVRAAMVVLAKMTNTASKRIGVIGRHLLVPPDLMYTAQVIAGTSGEPGTANNDINPLNGKLNPITVPNWTDTNNWYLLADPSQIESIELGFLNGREEPELLVQDNPTAGSVFTNDAITYKVRWIFGGGWLDYRGAFGSVVT